MFSSSGRMDSQDSHEDLRELGNWLHKRMLDGDVTVFGEIAELMLPIITDRLSRKFPNLDDSHLIDTSIVDSLLSYEKNPSQYDPDRKRLDNYLYMSARGDLINLLERNKEDNVLVALPEIVELDDEDSEYNVKAPDVSSGNNVETEVLIRLSPTWRNLCQLFPDELDREMLQFFPAGRGRC